MVDRASIGGIELHVQEWVNILRWLSDQITDEDEDAVGLRLYNLLSSELNDVLQENEVDSCIVCQWQTEGLNDRQICATCAAGMGERQS